MNIKNVPCASRCDMERFAAIIGSKCVQCGAKVGECSCVVLCPICGNRLVGDWCNGIHPRIKRVRVAGQRCGIYKICCAFSPAMYVGQASDIDERWWSHLSDLRNRRHCNTNLQRMADEYGWNTLYLVVIEQCGVDSLNQRESHWIETLKPTLNIRI